jgi:hypothetical protein
MEQPLDFVPQEGSSSMVCKLKKALYGLKQFPQTWFSCYSIVVLKFGLAWSEWLFCFFYRNSKSDLRILLLVYTEDSNIIEDDVDGINELKAHVHQHFQTKDWIPCFTLLILKLLNLSKAFIYLKRNLC